MDSPVTQVQVFPSPAPPRMRHQRQTRMDINSENKFKEDFEIIPMNNSVPRIRIHSNELRKFIYEYTESEALEMRCIELDDDDVGVKQNRLMLATVSLGKFFGDLTEFKEITPDEITESGTGLGPSAFVTFVSIIEKYKIIQEEKAAAAFSTGFVTFEQLASVLSSPGRHLALVHDGNLVGIKTISAEILSSVFGGAHLRIIGAIYVNKGRELKTEEVTFKIPGYRGEKSLVELCIFDLENSDTPTSQRINLIERGKKYVELTLKAAYVQYEGSIKRRSYWSNNEYKSTGRIMVDHLAMSNIDPDYSKYFGGNGHIHDGTEESGVISRDEITDQILMCTSPYVYGFSFVSKVWGEFKVENVSNIQFRDNAYDNLVLDADTKDILFSLVDNDYSSSGDFISGKGGGCIFLLNGDPGVGKLDCRVK